jgi:tetratricopeptide (TPR) repeat protein
MIVFKCKICGGNLEIEQQALISTCGSCGTTHSLPKNVNDDKIRNLYERANQLRRDHAFDKSMGMYETILTEQPNDPEVYWSLVLCKYGVEYVEDPMTKQRVITTHRTLPQSVQVDPDYKKAMQLAGGETKILYEREAQSIDDIQKGILTISNQENPYDIFICYKETDDLGKRTIDSMAAQEIYDELEVLGYNVFFARITLEDKLGQEYEPYIYSALKTSKVMLVIGTRKAYFEAPWVRNEWSRYLSMMKVDKNKKIIPLYKDIDAYDLPEEFRIFQSQDLNKIGATQDLLRGINKILPQKDFTVLNSSEPKQQSTSLDQNNLLKRAKIALEDRDYDSAITFAEKMLDINPEDAQAYYIRFLAKNKYASIQECFKIDNDMIEEYAQDIKKIDKYFEESLDENDSDYRKIIKYGKKSVYKEILEVFDSNRLATITYVIHFLSNKVDSLSPGHNQKKSLLEDVLKKLEKISKLSILKPTDIHVLKLIERKTIECVTQLADLMQGNDSSNFDYVINFLKPYVHIETIQNYLDNLSDKQNQILLKKQEEAAIQTLSLYENLLSLIKKNTISAYRKSLQISFRIPGFRDVDSLKAFVLTKLAELEKVRRKKVTRLTLIITFLVSVVISTGYIIFNTLPLAEIRLNGAVYVKNGNTYTLSAYNAGDSDNWKMPNGVRGLPVTKIGYKAFFRQSLRTIELGYFVEQIEEEAFLESDLISISLSPRLRVIEAKAFSQTSLIALTIPNYVEEIGESILEGTYSLKSLSLPFMGDDKEANKSLHYLFGNTFPINIAMDFVSINQQSIIPSLAFKDFSISELYIGKSVQEVMLNAFGQISSLHKIYLPFLGENRNSSVYYYLGYGFGAEILAEQTNSIPETLKHLVIHDDNQIEPFALSQLEHIESLTFIEGTNRISSYAITQNTGLREIFLSSSIRYVGPLGIYQVGDAILYIEHPTIPLEWSERWNESQLEIVLGATINA